MTIFRVVAAASAVVGLCSIAFGACDSESMVGSVGRPGTWSLVSVPTTNGFTIVRGSGPADVWVAGGDSVWRWDGQNWSSPSGFRMGPGAAFWVNSPTDAWAGVGQKVAYHWTGTGWVSALLNDNRVARALWGSGPSDVWASDCEAGYLGHYDGTGWTHLQSIDNGRAIWGTHSGDVWIIDAYCIPSSSEPSSIVHGNGISGNGTSGY